MKRGNFMKCRVLPTLALALAVGLAVPVGAAADPLADAARAGKLKAVKALLAACEDEHMPVTAGAEALAGWITTCLRLDVHAALRRAAAAGAPEIITVLLAAGAEVNARESYGIAPLYLAARSGDVEAVTILLAAGADVHDRSAREAGGDTPLHNAAESGRPAVVKALLAAGANPAVENSFGNTPLGVARWAQQQLSPDDVEGRRSLDQIIELLQAAMGAR